MVRHGAALLRQSFAVSLPGVDTKRSAAHAVPTTSAVITRAHRTLRTFIRTACMGLPLNSRHELVRAHVAARAGRARVALEVGRGGSGAGARVDGGRTRAQVEGIRQERIGLVVTAEIVQRSLPHADVSMVEIVRRPVPLHAPILLRPHYLFSSPIT